MIPSAVRIFVCTERQDMRRSFDALALVVRESLALDPESGALFVFASKRSNRVKVLWFDRNGYCISTSACTVRCSSCRRRVTRARAPSRSTRARSRRSFAASQSDLTIDFALTRDRASIMKSA